MSSKANEHGCVSVFHLAENCVFLSDEGGLKAVEKGSPDWRDIFSGRNPTRGRIFAMHEVRTDQDVHSSQWEMHPAGEELIGVISGHVSLILQDASGSRHTHLTAMTGAIVPARVRHRFKVFVPTLLFTVTRGEGTELQGVTNE